MNPVTRRAADMAAEIYRGKATRPDEVAARLEANRAELRPVLGDRLPSPGALAEDPGIVAFERELAMRDRNPTILREQAINAGLRDVVDGLAPQGDPAKLQLAASEEAARLRAETQTANDAAIAQRQLRVDTVEGRAQTADAARRGDAAPLAPYQSADAAAGASQRLDNAVVDQTYLPDRTRKNELYSAVDPNRTEMVDATPMIDAATRVRQQINELGPQGQQLPAEFVQRVERLAPNIEQQPSRVLGPDGAPVMRDVNTGGTGQAAVGDIVDLQKYTGKARETARQAGNFDLADNIGQLRAGASRAVEGSPAAAEANNNYAENFAPKYRPGPGDEMAKFTKEIDRDATRSTTPPSETAKRFLSSPEKAAALRRVLDDSPAGAQGNAAVRDYLLSDLATSGVIDSRSGMIRPDRLRAWRQSYGNQLEAAPGFGSEVDAMIARAQKGERVSDGLAQQIKAAQTRLRETERAAGRSERDIDDRISKGALGAVIDADPDKAVHSIMQNQANAAGRLRELAALTANNPDARAGLKAAVRDYLIDRGTTSAVEKLPPGDSRSPLSPAKVQALFGDHANALTAVFSPAEMSAMRVVQKALELQRTEQVRVRSGSDTIEKGLSASVFDNARDTPLGRAAEIVTRLKFGMLKGGGMIASARRFLGNMTPEDSRQALDLLNRAAIDPDLALLLASREVKVGSPQYVNTVQRLLGAAAATRESVSEDERRPLEVTVRPTRN